MLENVLERIKSLPKQTEESLNDALGLIVQIEDIPKLLKWLRWVRKEAMAIRTAGALEIVRKTWFAAAPHNFDAFMVAMEWNREPKAKFWLPRRKVLEGKHKIATQIQEFMDDPEALYLGFSQPPGTGKALANDTPILTRNGWKNHGDLIVGDEVISPDGEFVKVTHVFPKVLCDRVVSFSNGERIVCHAQHEWPVHDRGKRRDEVYETSYLERRKLESGPQSGRGHRYVIQSRNRKTIVGETKELPIPPYTLGAWLGDGTNRNPTICGDKKDFAIIERVKEDGYEIAWETTQKNTGVKYYGIRGLRFDLQKVGLCHSRRKVEKYIPEEYLTASIEQRLALLAGLLDTDGCKAGETKYRFTTAEEKLKDTMVELLSTFAWRSCVVYVPPRISSSGIVGKRGCWCIQFTPDMPIPCVLSRKQIDHTPIRRAIAITKVERITPVEGNCISVEGGLYCAGKTLIPTHNSTLIKFLLAYIAGTDPNSANIYCSYSDGMVKMMLDAVRAMLTDPEYCFNEIFPEIGTPDVSAEYKTISYRRKGDFPTVGLISLGGSVTGRTRANRLMISDDLVKNKEEARSPERLQKLYEDYTATLTTRMIGDSVKQISLGTRWSAYDPIGRMEADHGDDPRYKFIAIPVWDENEVSNFEYEHPDRYTTAKIRDIKNTIDSADFECLFMQHGIEKEGLAFPADGLRYYNGVLPDGEPDNICFVNDVAWGGGDSLSMPIAYVYGSDVYIHDWIFDRRDKSVTKPRVIAKILSHKVKMGETEANNGGEEYSDDVSRVLRQEYSYSINMSHKKAPTNMAKLTRIEQHAPTIRNFYFRDSNCRDDDYRRAMNELTGFSFTAKNVHDDAADSMAMMAAYVFGRHKEITVFPRPF